MISVLKNLVKIKHMSDDIKIIYIYRYFSLAITSLFYVVTNNQSSIKNKLIMILCLSISSIILNYLYIKVDAGKTIIKLLILIEIIVNTVILIPTGGINSPYIWYSLNTILINIYFLNIYYCMMNLVFYLIVSSEVSAYIFDKADHNLEKNLIINSNLILSFVLITLAIYLLFKLADKIGREREQLKILNNQLANTNKRLNESMEYTMSLYQAVYSFVNIKNGDKAIRLLVDYTKKITKANNVFFFEPCSSEEMLILFDSNITECSKHAISSVITNNLNDIKDSDEPVYIFEGNYDYIAVTVKSLNKIYGILGVEINLSQDKVIIRENIDQLRFLASLSSVVFEKNELEQINERLVISEEQNRIANEIHDSVSQRLFAAACGIHSLTKKVMNNYSVDVIEDFNAIRDSINNSIKELRETIYRLSWRKKGHSAFKENIESFIEDISKLNNVDILFDLVGDEEFISTDVKKALYRIICECIGNSVRHGKSTNIKIQIHIERIYTSLEIIDNGIGFNVDDRTKAKNGGLGLSNIFNLVYLFSGKIKINSSDNEGTRVDVLFPNNTLSDVEVVV